jgi:hypothetical protein
VVRKPFLRFKIKESAINDHYSKSIEGEASSQQAVKSCSLRQRRTSWYHQLQESKKRRADSLKLLKRGLVAQVVRALH